MPEKLSTQLRKAMRAGTLVRFTSRHEKGTVNGYVVDVGPRFFLLRSVSERIRFNGYECHRIADLTGLRAAPFTKFVETALKKRGEKRGRKPRIDLTDIETLLRSASKAFPLVTIHLHRLYPDTCYIGRVEDTGKGRLSLLEIDPGAEWDAEPETYPLRSITRVDFGGDYEDALHLVGGEPSGSSKRPKSR